MDGLWGGKAGKYPNRAELKEKERDLYRCGRQGKDEETYPAGTLPRPGSSLNKMSQIIDSEAR